MQAHGDPNFSSRPCAGKAAPRNLGAGLERAFLGVLGRFLSPEEQGLDKVSRGHAKRGRTVAGCLRIGLQMSAAAGPGR